MNVKMNWLIRAYRRVLRLYPYQFRQEYEQEMLSVFELQIAGMGSKTLLQMLKHLVRELRDLPVLLAAAYLQERRMGFMRTNLDRWFSPSQGSWKEMLLASLPYLLMGFLPGLVSLIMKDYQTQNIYGLIVLAGLGLLLIALGIIGLIVKLPRWSLVYAGILLTLLTFGTMVLLVNLKVIPTPGWSSYLVTGVFLAAFLVILFLVVGISLVLSGKIPLTAEFYQKAKSDPSLLSFMLYGGTLVIVLANFEDVTRENWFLILAAITMICGAGGFLYSKTRRNRLRSLFWGNTLAMAFSLAANLLLVDYGLAPAFYVGGLLIERAVIFVCFTWLTSMVMIFFPLVIKHLEKGSQLVSSENG